MRTMRTWLLLAAVLTIPACGIPTEPGLELPQDPDAPVIQVKSEGGFAPVELILGQGPRYTLLADGRLIYEGPVIAIYPGPLLPNYQVTPISEEQMASALALVDDIGLPDMDSEIDDSAASRVADATTELITYWDDNGVHTYAVYALGIDLDDTPSPATRAFSDLLEVLGDLSAGEATPYEAERVRIIAGPGFVNDEFEDVRDWPLESDDLSTWDVLPNGWQCQVFEPEILDRFADATQATQWTGSEGSDMDLVKLLVRPLHPGEPDCPSN